MSWMLASDPRLIGTAVADASGTVHLQGQIPVDVPPGDHHLTAAGLGPDGSGKRVVEAVTVRRRGFVLASAAILAGILLPALVFVRVRRRLR